MNAVLMNAWCNGYKDRRTCKFYYHAESQTEVTPRPMDLEYSINSKLNQTATWLMFPPVERGVVTRRSTGTQMWRHNLHVSSLQDKIIEPGDYVPYQWVPPQKIIYKIEEPKPIILFYDKCEATKIDSLPIQRIRDLQKWYNKYLSKFNTKEDKIKLVMDLISYLPCLEEVDDTQPIIELLTQEKHMLEINEKYTSGLKKRIILLFSNFLNKLECSLEQPMNVVVFECPSCQEYLPPSSFKWATSINPRYCTNCSLLIRNSVCKEGMLGMAPYMEIIIEIREEDNSSGNPIPLLITPMEIKELIEKVWEGSVVSGERDPERLSLPRWDRCRPWSPWNCVALTKYEARTHKTQRSLDLFYSKLFIKKIIMNHKEGRNLFPQFTVMENK